MGFTAAREWQVRAVDLVAKAAFVVVPPMVAAAVVPVGTPAMEEMPVLPEVPQVLVVQAAAAVAA